VSDPHLHLVVGDVLNAQDINAAMAGQDARADVAAFVLSALMGPVSKLENSQNSLMSQGLN